MSIVIANWKMNPQTIKDAKALFYDTSDGVRKFKNVETIICPPFVYLSFFANLTSIKLGAQDLFWENPSTGVGAYTGEISGKMLKDLGCSYVIVGHSERRHWLGESDEMINLKLKAALGAKLTPILCVGERAGEDMGVVVGEQLKGCLKDVSKAQIKEIIIAYEPVWAIGTGNACSPDNALSATVLIKKVLTALYGRFLAEKIPVLYGGSVDATNSASYIKEAGMAGLLVGGSSLEAEEFVRIGEAVNNL